MELRGVVLKFKLGPNDTLKRLCTEREYSKPTSQDDIRLGKKLQGDYGSIEIHKKDNETLMVLVRPAPDSKDGFVAQAVGQVLEDLAEVGLYTDIPF